VHWLGARRGLESEIVSKRDIPLTLVHIEGIRARGPAAALRAVAQLPTAIAVAVRSTVALQPEAVLGVGGYASAAGVIAAGMLGIPWMLQEQNSVPGWTNTTFAPWADLICCGFADALECFPSQPAEWTGNPVRSQFFEGSERRPAEPRRVLVLGGSQGSLFLNRALPQAVAELRREGVEVEVLHQAGSRWVEVVRTGYLDEGLEAEVTAFLDEPWQAMFDADLVVARSGALTVSELAAAGRAALLVPFAASAGNHQEHNARSLEKAGGAVVLTERQANTAGLLVRTLSGLLEDADRLTAMGQACSAVARPNAAQRIADRLLSLSAGGAS
jgi:UDP-N-acetylglucosamine--N-acetylmuramyl-(pentapeptide) pyrophosphoryl-undecaprenol N-acetylglucosamine transferase